MRLTWNSSVTTSGPGLRTVQGAVMTGWHGVRDAAKVNGVGRTGGTAVLVRRPSQIIRGAELGWASIAIVC